MVKEEVERKEFTPYSSNSIQCRRHVCQANAQYLIRLGKDDFRIWSNLILFGISMATDVPTLSNNIPTITKIWRHKWRMSYPKIMKFVEYIIE